MGNWWIDETPYPGPDHDTDPFTRLFNDFSSAFAHFYAPSRLIITARAFGKLKDQLKLAGKEHFILYPNDFLLDPEEEPREPEDPRREAALKKKQSRSTGPASGPTFSRNGRRRY